MGWWDAVTDFFGSVGDVISDTADFIGGVASTVVDFFVPSSDFGSGSTESYTQDAAQSPQYELSGFRNIVSNMVPSALL